MDGVQLLRQHHSFFLISPDVNKEVILVDMSLVLASQVWLF